MFTLIACGLALVGAWWLIERFRPADMVGEATLRRINSEAYAREIHDEAPMMARRMRRVPSAPGAYVRPVGERRTR